MSKQQRRQWIKFFFLATGEAFSIGKLEYRKVGFITAEEVATGETRTILFWKEVRSYRVFPGRKSELQKRSKDRMELGNTPVTVTPTPPRPPELL